MATIEIPFELGEPCWHAKADWHKMRDTCPDCGGSGKVRVVFHDGVTVRVRCHQCLHHPGEVFRTVCRYVPTRYAPERICDFHGGLVRYIPASGSGPIVSAEDLSETEELCAARCAELQAEHAIEEERHRVAIAERNHDMAGSSARQRRAKVRKLREELEILESDMEAPGA